MGKLDCSIQITLMTMDCKLCKGMCWSVSMGVTCQFVTWAGMTVMLKWCATTSLAATTVRETRSVWSIVRFEIMYCLFQLVKYFPHNFHSTLLVQSTTWARMWCAMEQSTPSVSVPSILQVQFAMTETVPLESHVEKVSMGDEKLTFKFIWGYR